MILHSVCHRPRQIVCTIPENCCSFCCLEARSYHENPDLPAGCDFETLLDRQATAGRPVVLFSHRHLRKERSCRTSSTALVTKLALSMNHHQINMNCICHIVIQRFQSGICGNFGLNIRHNSSQTIQTGANLITSRQLHHLSLSVHRSPWNPMIFIIIAHIIYHLTIFYRYTGYIITRIFRHTHLASSCPTLQTAVRRGVLSRRPSELFNHGEAAGVGASQEHTWAAKALILTSP